MTETDGAATAAFHAKLKGRFAGIMHWRELDALWDRVQSGAWYFYQLGESLPATALRGEELRHRIAALNELLRREHDYDYCGIVYADNVDQPTLIKVYDPNNMGTSCSHGTTPSPPGWILSIAPPALIETQAPAPNNRRRWWRLFSQ